MGLLALGQAAAKSAIQQERVQLGPWLGSMRSIPANQVPKEFIAGGTDFLYLPREGYWRRRKGQTQKFDTFGASVGLLPAKWASKCRQLEEFKSDTISDDIPTLIALLTKETVVTGLDDGRFSNLWVRDQVQNVNYTLGSDYHATNTYPVPGTEQTYRVVPLWYDSGDGGLTRGTSEFARRFFVSGSRKTLKVGNWRYSPSLYGTPSRWNELIAGAASANQVSRPVSDSAAGFWTVGTGSGSSLFAAVDDTAADLSPAVAEYVFLATTTTSTVRFNLTTTLTNPGTLDATLVIDARATSGDPTTKRFFVTIDADGGGTVLYSGYAVPGLTGSFVTYTVPMTFSATPTLWTGLRIGIEGGSSGGPLDGEYQISRVELTLEGVGGATSVNRLIPSGPLPPTHAGILTASTIVEDSATKVYPETPDISAGTWVKSTGGGTVLYTMIDDGATVNDTDYILTSATSDTCEVSLGSFGFTPAADEQVTVRYRASRTGGAGILTVRLIQGSTIIASEVNTTLTTSLTDCGFDLTPVQISAVTDWTDVRLRFEVSVNPSLFGFYVSWAALQHISTAATAGGWKGSKKFYYTVAGRFEDDSIHMFPIPRGPNDTLANGFNLFQVSTTNTSATYQKVTWTGIPILPFGYKSRILMRTPEIDATTESTLVLNRFDWRIVPDGEIKDNTTTEFVDFNADDDSLIPMFQVPALADVDAYVQPPRARYIFGGDSRICHSYGGINPGAIIIAPVGHTVAYDLNLDDDDSSLYGAAHAMYMRVEMATNGDSILRLTHSDGTTPADTTIDLTTTDTLEELVDAINATTVASTGKMWRAQILPGANPQADPNVCLSPHIRDIASCVVDDTAKTITKTAGGLGKVAVGAFVLRSGTVTSAYITQINSDTVLTYTGTITAGTVTLSFVFELGDYPSAATVGKGYQRVIAGSLPGFLYFNKTYLDRFPIEKNAVWMTVASPGSIKSAANCFSGRISNKHTPPGDAGFSMGGYAVDNGFVTPFSKKNTAIRNTRDSGTGLDADYKLFVLNESRGCIAWQSVDGNGRAGVFFSPQGLVASDLFHEGIISRDIYLHAKSDAVAGVGDFAYEAPVCDAATGADTDTAYLSARIMRGCVFVNYRASVAAVAHPNRQVVYDFSEGVGEGLQAMLRPNGSPWGWSVPLVRSVTALAEGRRSDGSHLYGWNEANAGSTGDGRVDEIEVTDQDNLVDIAASATTGWIHRGRKVSVQEFTTMHKSPTSSTGTFTFTRSFEVDVYTFTPSTSSSLVVSRDVKMLTLPARSATAAFMLGFTQATGSAREWRSTEVRFKDLPSYT